MIKQQKITRYALCIIALVVSTGISFAKGGDDKDKDKLTEKSGIASRDQDSIYTTLDVDVALHVDDTLVFEDWDGQGGGSGDDGGIGLPNGGSADLDRERSGTSLIGNSTESNLESIYKTTFQKEYRVEFTLFPNPTIEHITIKPDVVPKSMIITDISGKTHRNESYSSHVNVAELPSGTYILSLIYPDHVEARKFIKR
jgi:hypothetical protein